MSVVVAGVLWAISVLLLIVGGMLAEERRSDGAGVAVLLGLVLGACALWVIA